MPGNLPGRGERTKKHKEKAAKNGKKFGELVKPGSSKNKMPARKQRKGY